MTATISFDNDWTVFFTRPVSGTLMAIALLALVYPVLRSSWRARHGMPPSR
jgi:putative tricarboxylic transport membrane protein